MGLENGNRIGIDLSITPERIKAPIVIRELSNFPKQEIFALKELKPEGLPESERDLRHVDPEKTPEKNSASSDGFEPFEDPSISEDLFVNGYSGNFARDMKLNRKAMERVLKIAHLDGKVFLSSLDPSRKRSVEANPDSSVTAKRGLFVGQKIEDENKEPLYRVESVPQGWNIEINDKRMAEELSNKGLKGERLKKEFIKKFNTLLNTSIFAAVKREKLSNEKDENFRDKVMASVCYPSGAFIFGISIFGLSIPGVLLNALIFLPLSYVPINCMHFESKRKIDNPWERFMPFVEIDKVARTFAFLKGKGRKLVK